MRKNQGILLALFISISIFISACTKDDVKLTNRNINKYLPGRWDVVTINDLPYDSNENLILDFDDDGSMSYIFQYVYENETATYSYSGTWSFDDNNDKLHLTTIEDGDTYTYTFDVIQLGKENLELLGSDNEYYVLEKQ